jgi:hypothetical protein
MPIIVSSIAVFHDHALQVKTSSNMFKTTVQAAKGGEHLLQLAGWKTSVVNMEKFYVFDGEARAGFLCALSLWLGLTGIDLCSTLVLLPACPSLLPQVSQAATSGRSWRRQQPCCAKGWV